MTRAEAPLKAALKDLAATFSDYDIANGVGTAMTCLEADALARVLVAAGHRHEAALFLVGHANDDGPDDAHALVDFEDTAREYIDTHPEWQP